MPNRCQRHRSEHCAKSSNIRNINRNWGNMFPFNDPQKTDRRHYNQSHRYQRFPPDIYELEHFIARDAHMSREEHTVLQHQHGQWSWGESGNHYFNGPPAVSKSFSSIGSDILSNHQIMHDPSWPLMSQPNHIYMPPLTNHRLQPPVPPSPPMVSSQPSKALYSHQKPDYKPPVRNGTQFIYDLRDDDVLCGRGAPSNFHGGNRFFKDLVNRYQSSYLAARRHDKPEIASAIVQHVHERGGRFLKRVKMQGRGPTGHFCWQEIGEQRAYEKACQALREGAPELRRNLASKEIAAAALCLDRLSALPHPRLQKVGSNGGNGSATPDERDDLPTRFTGTDDRE